MRKGFTLIEILVSISVIVVLTSIYFFVANPAQQLGAARNSERQLQLQTIMNAIRQNIADQSNQQFSCTSGSLPTSTKKMTSSVGGYNIAPCLVPTYGIFTIPFDPTTSTAHWVSISDYDSGYTIILNASGSITLAAPAAELKQTVSITR
jgi:prepilin-type N-terminal cleavage/methylation domain-containing protein